VVNIQIIQQATPTCEDLKVIATDDIITTSKDEICIDLIPIDNIPVLDNDTSESENYDLVVSKLHFTGSHGLCEVTLDGKGVKYTPNDEFTGEDTCVYEVCDANDSEVECDIATITITVFSSEDDVEAIDDLVETDKETSKEVNVIENDVGVPCHELYIKEVMSTEVTVGECIPVNDTFVMYIPKPNFVGVDECGYITCDDRGRCDSAMIIIEVVGEKDDPCDNDEEGTKTPSETPPEIPGTLPPTSEGDSTSDSTPTPTTDQPTPLPTGQPSTANPTSNPTPAPTTANPTSEPKPYPSEKPTSEPTPEPTPYPSEKPMLRMFMVVNVVYS